VVKPKARARARRYWLLKTEAECFPYESLENSPRRRTGWDGVRNYQARNFLRDDFAVGDGVLFYHSNGEPPGVAGIARVSGAAEPDPTQFDPAEQHFDPKSRREAPTWVQVEIEARARLPRFVPLALLRATPELASMRLLERGQRLSVLPVEPEEWQVVLRLGGLDPELF
jgi:predicted RNA-binding protein with PUA-like domain